MSNNQVSVVPAAAEESLIGMAKAAAGHDAALSALVAAHKAGDRAAFDKAWTVAVAGVAETESLSYTVSEAERFVQAGRSAIDAHVTYRLAIVGERRGMLPRESKADLARALYGPTEDTRVQNTREVMVGRDLKALDVLAAIGPRRKADISEVMTAVNRASKAEMSAITARAAAGEPLVADKAAAKAEAAAKREAAKAERESKPLDAGVIVSEVATIIDRLGRVADIDGDVRTALLDALAKAEALVHRLPATVVVVDSAPATATA